MREILFRGKTKRNEWIYGDLITHGIDFDDAIKQHHTREVWDIIPETVGQYTGLTDKNGKKIFEGDIIKEKDYIGVAVIAYESASFVYKKTEYLNTNWYCGECIDDNENGFIGDWVEVIGNIYDNPELLEVNQ